MRHHFKILSRILLQRRKLLISYLKMVMLSIHYHKLSSAKDESIFNRRFVNYQIGFPSYPQLINLFEEIFVFEVYRFSNSSIKPLIIDCGSNIGVSVLYFKYTYPECNIIAFEPDPGCFNILRNTIELNSLKGVELNNVALGNGDRERTLYSNPDSGSKLTMSLFASEEKKKSQTVLTTQLSNFIEEDVDLLKLDVEGAEIEIIDDLIENNKLRMVKTMIIEYHVEITKCPVETFISKIEKAGFKCSWEQDLLHPGATEVIIRSTRL